MKAFIELFGLDPEQFNEVGLSLATKDLSYCDGYFYCLCSCWLYGFSGQS